MTKTFISHHAFVGWMLLASSMQVQSAELCLTNEAARLSRLYHSQGLSGLIAASEACHRHRLNCQFVDAFGYTLNQQYCSKSPCVPTRYFDAASIHHRNPLYGADKGKEASLLCAEVRDLISSSVDIVLSN